MSSDTKDELGARIKGYEAHHTSLTVDHHQPIIIRVDGKAFHTYTKGMEKPFDRALMASMDHTATTLLDLVQDAKLAYVQSDEISLLLWNPNQRNGQPYFGGKVQKIASVVASMATVHFNDAMRRRERTSYDKPAYFDARVFNVPDMVEATNYYLWRLFDWRRNFTSVVASTLFSPKELKGKSTKERDAMIQEKLCENQFGPDGSELDLGSWRDDYTYDQQYGRMYAKMGRETKQLYLSDDTYTYEGLREYIDDVLATHAAYEEQSV